MPKAARVETATLRRCLSCRQWILLVRDVADPEKWHALSYSSSCFEVLLGRKGLEARQANRAEPVDGDSAPAYYVSHFSTCGDVEGFRAAKKAMQEEAAKG